MCNWSHNWWWRRYVQRICRVIFSCGITWYHSFRVQFLSDLHITNKKWSCNVCISFSVIFYQIRLGGNSCNIKPMPVILVFSAAHYSFSNMWNFYWNPCLVRKLSDIMKAYTISVPPPVLSWIWWYIDTFNIV